MPSLLRDAHPRPPLHVVLTGASSGLGRAAAVELARRGGVHLTLVARRRDALAETERLLRDAAARDVTVSLEPCDLAHDAALDALVTRLTGPDRPRVDVLVNNAGMGGDARFTHRAAAAEADAMLQLNLRAPVLLTHALLPQLLASRRAAIVNVSSVAGMLGTPGAPVYSATKWGLTGFSEALRAQLAPHGVRVVCVQPGPVPTEGWPHAWLARRRILAPLLASTAVDVGRTIADAATGRGGVNPVRPRTYAAVHTLRGVAPWAVRALLAFAVRSGFASGVRGRPQPAARPEGGAPHPAQEAAQ